MDESKLSPNIAKNSETTRKISTPFTLIVGAILIFTLGLLSGFMIRSNNAPPTLDNRSTQTLIPTKSQTATATIQDSNQTKDWKEYSGQNFTFKYPQKLQKKSLSPNEVIFQAIDDGNLYLQNQSIPFSDIAQRKIIPVKDFKNGQIVTYTPSVEAISEKREFYWSGKLVQQYAFGCGTDCGYYIFRFQVGDQYYQLIMSDNTGGMLQNTFNQIIQTFQFTN